MSSPVSPRRSRRLSLKGNITNNASTKRRTKSFGGPSERRASPKPNLKPKKSLLKSSFRHDNQTVVGIMPVTDKPKKGVRFSFAPSPRRNYSSSPMAITSSPLSSRSLSPRRSPSRHDMDSGSESDTDVDMEDATDVYDNSPPRFPRPAHREDFEISNDDEEEVTMDITEIVRPSIRSEESKGEDEDEQGDDETAMDLTQAIGKITSGKQQENQQYKNFTTSYQQDGDTMDLTMALGKIHQIDGNTENAQDESDDEEDECDMEFTIPLGRVHTSKLDEPEGTVGDDTIDSVEQTMELTMAIGTIKHDDQYRRDESSDVSDSGEVDMDVTQAHGRLLNNEEIKSLASRGRVQREASNFSPRNAKLSRNPVSPRQMADNKTRSPLRSLERLPNEKASTPRNSNMRSPSSRSKNGSVKRTPRLSEVVDIQHGSPRPKVKTPVLRSSPRYKDDNANNENGNTMNTSPSRIANNLALHGSMDNSTPMKLASSKSHTLSPSTTPRWGSGLASRNNMYSQTVVMPSRRLMSTSPERKRQCLSSPTRSPKRSPNGRKERENFSNVRSIKKTEIKADISKSGHTATERGPIPLSEFLRQCSVQFLDSLMDSATMRPISVGEEERCKSPSREESMKALYLSSAWLELYRFSCNHLKNNIDSGKELVAGLETETMEETPQFFYEYVEGSVDFKSAIEQQFRILKNHSRLMAKSVWYDWRSNVIEGIKPGISKNLNKARQDIELLSKSSADVEQASKEIKDEYHTVQERLEQLRTEQAESLTNDSQETKTIRKRIVEVEKAVKRNGEILADRKSEHEQFLYKINIAKDEAIRVKESISEMEKIKESNKRYAIEEINQLVIKTKEFERANGWCLNSINGSKASFVYREEIRVDLDFDEAQGTCLVAMSLIEKGSGLDLAVRQFGLESALNDKRGNKAAIEVLKGTAEMWGQVKKLNKILRRLAYHVPTKISLQENHLKVEMQLFIESVKAKCLAVLKIDSSILQTSSNRGAFLDSVEWCYGTNNYTSKLEDIIREKVSADTKVESLADLCDAVTSGQYC